MSASNLMAFGIAVNFFGNYAQEASKLEAMNERVYEGFNRLKHLVIGAGVTSALYSFGNSLMHTAKDLESVYATLFTVFGSKNRVLEHFKEAREFVAKNPIMDLNQIHEATEQLAMAGQAKTGEMTNKNLQYLGDFAQGNNMDISTAIQAAINAGNGNWEMLRNRGFDNRNLRQTASNAHGKFTDTDGVEKLKSTELLKVADALAKAKVGTDEYRASVIKFLGIYEAGGMANASKTITGSLKSAHNLVEIFKMSIVGMTQESGTLSNVIGTDLGSAISKISSRFHQIEKIGEGVGQILIGVWGGVGNALGEGADFLVKWIDKLNAFFSDYQNNIAPIILFLFLIRLEVEDFVKGFYEGFKNSFGFFLVTIWQILVYLAKFAQWLGIGKTSSEALGKVLGTVVGTMLGIRAVKFVASQFTPIVEGARMALKAIGSVLFWLDKVILKQRIFNGLQRMAGGNVNSGWILLKGAFSSLLAPLTSATTAMGGFATATTIAGLPVWAIALAIVAVIAVIALMIIYWDEITASVKKMGDGVIILIALFLPFIGIPMLLIKHWNSFKVIFTNIIKGVWFYIKSWWLWLKEAFFALIKFLVTPFVLVYQAIVAFVKYIMEKFPLLKTIIGFIVAPFVLLWEALKGVWDFIVKIWDKLMNSNFVAGLLKFGETLSKAFAQGGEDSYKERLKEYDPEQYEKEYGKKVEDKLSKTKGNTTTKTIDNSQDNKTHVSVTGNTFVTPYNPVDYGAKMTEIAKLQGK